MSVPRIFSLIEANTLIPQLKTMLTQANEEITAKADLLAEAYSLYENCEQDMSLIKTAKSADTVDDTGDKNDFTKLRESRLQFQSSIEALSLAKENYVQILSFWMEEISDKGVILRDIKTGLLDFPARSSNFDYYLCWQLNENDIRYWHPMNEGFMGRKPLSVLSEYLS